MVIKRLRNPFVGFWVPPGGKIEPGESPHECAVRELKEETGLTATKIEFRGLVHEVSSKPGWEWLIFVYLVREHEGVIVSEAPIDHVRWLPIDMLASEIIPPSDKIFLPRVLDDSKHPFEVKFQYDAELFLLDFTWEAGN